MKSSSKRTLSLLGSIALLVAALAAYSFLIKPEYEAVNELRGTLQAKTDLLEEQGRVIMQVQDLLAEAQNAAQLQKAISLALPLKEDTASVFAQLQALAQFNGLTIEVFDVQNISTKPARTNRAEAASVIKDIGVLQVSLRLSGPYQNFKNFLQGMEQNIRVMDVVNVKVEPIGGKTADFFIYNLSLKTYYQTD